MKVSDEPHEYTIEEQRQILLEHVWMLVNYWDKESRAKEPREKLEGLAFSLLSALDGCSAGLPGFALVPSTHHSDKEFHKKNGDPWFPHYGPVEGDIGGFLHELFQKARPKDS